MKKRLRKVTNTIIVIVIIIKTATIPNKNKIPTTAATMKNLRFNDILINDSIYGIYMYQNTRCMYQCVKCLSYTKSP